MTEPVPRRGMSMVGMGEASIRSLLAAERAAAAERLVDVQKSFADVVEAAKDSNGDDEHDPEGATIAVERQQLSALAAAARRALADIEAAMARLDAGAFGRCARCGTSIGDERLAARPMATLCIQCAREPGRR